MGAKRIPIKACKEIAEKYGQDHVILVSWSRAGNRTHVVTYGKSVRDCKLAAMGGNKLKKALGFPDELCHDVPARAKRKKEKK